MRELPAPFQTGCYTARARSRASRGRSSTEGEAAVSGLTPEGTACPSPFAHAAAARPSQVRPPRRGRPLCERCARQRPGERTRCLRCQRKVGPGCTPGCLLVELRGAARGRVGLCADWPHCRSAGGEVSWNQAVSDALFPAESTSTQSGRALEPAGSAFVRRWLGVIVFIASLFGAASSDQEWQDACLLGTPASWSPQFSHA